MTVKENQKSLLDDVQTVFNGTYSHLLRKCSDEITDIGHGRIETRSLTSSDELKEYSDWPGLHQVFELTRTVLTRTVLTRTVITKKTGEVRQETFYGITSLSPDKANPLRLIELTRNHWHIENKVHWVRDVTFGEDKSQVRCGSTPQVMACLRNTVISLMRSIGITNIAKACRMFSARPELALELIGIKI